jgi:hypothetical protein
MLSKTGLFRGISVSRCCTSCNDRVKVWFSSLAAVLQMLFRVVTLDSASAWRDSKSCQRRSLIKRDMSKAYIEQFRHILVIVPLLLLVGHIDSNQIGVLRPSALSDCQVPFLITLLFRISLSCCWYAECALVLPWSKELSIFFRLCSTS